MKPHASLEYRPDIDGLRALAVLAVIVFHIDSDLVPGGFIGVDFFFVISGYLITGLIMKGIESGSFSFTDFYTRRIKRIFPAYIVVALATLMVASWLLIPNDYIFYTTSLAASFAFVSNIFFSMLSWGYFGDRSEEFPLLHTWSLSVEEQFYFIFPILLVFLHRRCRKALPAVLAILGIGFVVWSEWRTGQVKSYFLLSSRAHELIIGALTFLLAQRLPAPRPLAANALAASGLALMLGSLFWIGEGIPFPGVNSLYPCLGVALVIFAGRSDNGISRLFRLRWMVGIGLISYSLYLWHWPILSFLRYRGVEIGPWIAAAAIGLTFLLSFLTYRFVEKPIRENRQIKFRFAFTRIYALPAAACLAIGLYSYVTEGAPVRFGAEVRELISSYSFERDLARSCSIRTDEYRKVTAAYLQEHCSFGDDRPRKAEVLLMGDSHANHFKPFVEQLAKDAGLKAVFHVQGSCAPIVGGPDLVPAETCRKRNADLLEIAGEFRYVVLGGHWSSDEVRGMEAGLAAAVEKIIATGATPVVFKDNPDYEIDLSQCILRKTRGWIPANTNCSIPYSDMERRTGKSDRIIDRIRQQHPQMLVIDPKTIMCNRMECVTHLANVALYKDSNHINAKAASLLAREYIARVENPLAGGARETASRTGTHALGAERREPAALFGNLPGVTRGLAIPVQ